jgi:uncharacterized protein
VRVDVADLVGRPGATRPLARTLHRDEIGSARGAWGPADEAHGGALDLDLVLEMLVDGLLVRGRVSFATTVACARCLTDVHEEHDLDVSEIYLDPVRAEEDEEVELGYELHVAEGSIDLEALLRDTVNSVLDLRTLCDDTCAGLCPVCGADRNTEDCGHQRSISRDPRWAVLETLDVPPG